MSIQNKLILFMLALLSAVVGTFTFLIFRSEHNILTTDSRQKQVQTLLAMAEVCREVAYNPGKKPDSRHFEKFWNTPALMEAACETSRGETSFHADRLLINDYLSDSSPPSAIPPVDTDMWGIIITSAGPTMLTATLPVRLQKNRSILARVNFSIKALDEKLSSGMRQMSARFFLLMGAAFIIGCVGILLIARLIIKPIHTLTKGARTIGAGQLDHRIVIKNRDEMGMLAWEFNHMAGKLKELDDMKKDFVDSITHDLRSPVTGIRLCSDLIQKQLAQHSHKKIPEQLFTINEHTERLNRFIDSLLEVSRIESGKLNLDIRTINLEELADRIVLPFQAYAHQKGLSLNLVVGQDIPDMEGDPDRIEQVLTNLVSNAIKFTDSGSVTVSVNAEPGLQEIRVADTGRGISPDDISHIFEKFHKSEKQSLQMAGGGQGAGVSPGAPRSGAGLGLFISKSIIEQHGGRISVESKSGEGSVFTIRLPKNETDHTSHR